MEEAARIAREEHGSTKIAVISGTHAPEHAIASYHVVGVGTRDYYRKLGYHLEGVYMVKSLTDDETAPAIVVCARLRCSMKATNTVYIILMMSPRRS